MKKTLGYILSLVGIAGLALSSVKGLQSALSFIPTSVLTSKPFMIGSLVVVAVGVVLLIQTGKPKQPREVPIYGKDGKTIVGYRRMETK